MNYEKFCMIIVVSVLFMLISEAICVQGLRPLRSHNKQDFPYLQYIISRAYSGPSRGGAGH